MANTRKAAESFTRNAYETTLSTTCGASDLTINVASTTGLTSPCYIVIEPDSATQREYIFIDSTIGATSLATTTVDNRYLTGSAAGSGLSHPANSKVRIAPVQQHFEDIWDAVGKVVDATWSSANAGSVKLDVAAATVNVAADEIAIIDADDSSLVKKESIADLVTGIASTGLAASSGQLSVSGLTTSEIAAGSLTDSTDTIASNDSDTQIPTSAAVLDLADTKLNLSGGTLSGNVAFGDNEASGVILKDYAETDVALTSSSGVVAIDLANGNTGSLTLTENVTDIDFTNVPTDGVSSFTLKITQDASSAYTVAINAITVNAGSDVTALTAGGAGFTMTATLSGIDIVTFLFFDAGTPFLNALQDFS